MPKVAHAVKELGRRMAARPTTYVTYKNKTSPRLPNAPKGGYYIEGTVEMGRAEGRGQYRVVCLVDLKDKVQKKYYSADHYGTGSDAGKKPTWVEFR